MGADSLRAAIEANNPGASVRGIERAAGLPQSYIAKYTAPGAEIEQMPRMETIKNISRATGLTIEEVHHHLCEDLGYPTAGPTLARRERTLLANYRRLTNRSREALDEYVQTMRDKAL